MAIPEGNARPPPALYDLPLAGGRGTLASMKRNAIPGSLVILWLMCAPIGRSQITVLERPDTAKTNNFYIGNRPPLLPSPLLKLPIGAVKPKGWLRKELELQAAGFHGHLGEISPFLGAENNAWLSPRGEGQHGWEEVPYWLKGFGDCAYLLGNESQVAQARVWLEAALHSQREDGFFGPRGQGAKSTVDSTGGKYDLWPNMVMLFCLQSHYEYSGDRRVLDLMTKYFRWELAAPEADFLPPFWQQQRAADNLLSVYWLYNRTGEKWLLDLAQKIHRHAANWTEGIASWHNVNMAQAFGGPTTFYLQSKDPRHLAASERNYQTIRDLYGQVPGGMFGGDENCRPGYTDPRQAVETCGLVEMMHSCELLLTITANPVWADRCEDVAFNSLPAALLADFTALRYLTAPNLVMSDRQSKSPGFQNGGPMLHYNPHDHRCCQHNYGHGWPYLAEHLWLATPDNGLAAAFYAESEVKARVGDGADVTVVEKTQYPFGEQVEFVLWTPRKIEFPLYLRVPGWCEQPLIKVNGKAQPLSARPLTFIRLTRSWRDGDRVSLTLPMRVSIRTWAKNHNSVSVDRGPLTYSLKIGERYVRAGGTDKWPGWEIHPTTPWNYGLVLNQKRLASSFKVVQKRWPVSNLPFTHEGVPIELAAKGKLIPEWQMDHLGLVGTLHPSPVKSDQPAQTITLIPMGAARLRIASFPVIGKGPEARPWPAALKLPYKPSASHCAEADTLAALADGVLPNNSNDHDLPRFTWWDHKGSQEWVQYDFAKARKVAAVEVYWFDDTPGGECGLPASWHVLYRDNDKWTEVPNARTSDVVKDKFNRVSFDPVETQALRLEVQLKPGFSGGILEWKVE
jgi:hypothetical protein